MRLLITTIDDPMITNDYVMDVIYLINKNLKDIKIVGVIVDSSNQFTTKSLKKSIEYTIALAIIAGLKETVKKAIKYFSFKLKKTFSKYFRSIENPSILSQVKKFGIPVFEVKNVNSQQSIKLISSLEPDLILNQTQVILKKKFLSMPKIGVLNRHNSLLPKYRGRLAPFWALYNNEKFTGVTIHFVTEKIDKGNIVSQKIIPIDEKDTYATLTEKCYKVAPGLTVEAIRKIKNGYKGIPIRNQEGSYFTTPTIKDAIRYRLAFKDRKNKNRH
ncbi:MAG: formyltransferase family protein [Thermoplasmata archaeon]